MSWSFQRAGVFVDAIDSLGSGQRLSVQLEQRVHATALFLSARSDTPLQHGKGPKSLFFEHAPYGFSTHVAHAGSLPHGAFEFHHSSSTAGPAGGAGYASAIPRVRHTAVRLIPNMEMMWACGTHSDPRQNTNPIDLSRFKRSFAANRVHDGAILVGQVQFCDA